MPSNHRLTTRSPPLLLVPRLSLSNCFVSSLAALPLYGYVTITAPTKETRAMVASHRIVSFLAEHKATGHETYEESAQTKVFLVPPSALTTHPSAHDTAKTPSSTSAGSTMVEAAQKNKTPCRLQILF